MATTNPNMVSFLAASDPVAALRLQQQQALAQQLMDTSQPNPNQTAAGGQTIRINPLENLADVGKQLTGAYIQKNTTDKLAQALQSGGQDSSSGTNGMAGGIDPSAPLTGNRGKDYMIRQMVGDTAYAEQVKAKLGNAYAGPNKLAEGQNTIGTGTYTDAQGRVHENAPMLNGMPYNPGQQQPPAPQPPNGGAQVSNGAMPPAQPPASTPDTVPAPVPVTSSSLSAPAAANNAMNALNGQNVDGSIPPLPPGATPLPPAPANLAAPMAGSIAGAKEKAEARGKAEGENEASVDKGVVGIDSRITNAMGTLDKMDVDNQTKPHGLFGEYVGEPLSRNVGSGNMATSQTKFEQKNANLFTQELGPLMQSIQGTKGSIPLINAIKDASQIPAYGSQKETSAAIQGLKDQLKIYQNNMHNSQQMTSGMGMPVPADSVITHQFVPGKGIVPIGGQ